MHISIASPGNGPRWPSAKWPPPRASACPARVGISQRTRQTLWRVQRSASETASETQRDVGQDRSPMSLENLPLPEGSSGLPFIGGAFDLINLLTAKHVFVANHVKKNGNVSRASLLGQEAIIVAGREHLNKILVKQRGLFTQGYFKTLSSLVGPNSMLGLDGEEHLTLRRLIGPAFQKKAVNSYLPAIVRLAEDHCSNWMRRGSIMFLQEARHYAFSVVTEAALGIDFPVGSWTKQDVLELFRTWIGGVLSLGIDLPFTKFGKALQARQRLIEMVDEMLEIAREDTNGQGGLRAMIFARDEDGKSLKRDQLQDTILSLIFAGYDTSATAASTLMLEMAKHPKVWDHVKKEQDDIVALHGPELTQAAMEAMVYTEAVVRESMRVLPPIDGTFKVATRTFELNGRRISKGSTVFPATGTTAKYFDDRWPLDAKFCPARYLHGASLDPSSDLVFGLGSHSCPGRILSIMENKILLATLARGYDFAVLNADPQIHNSPFPQPADSLPMVVKRREALSHC